MTHANTKQRIFEALDAGLASRPRQFQYDDALEILRPAMLVSAFTKGVFAETPWFEYMDLRFPYRVTIAALKSRSVLSEINAHGISHYCVWREDPTIIRFTNEKDAVFFQLMWDAA